MLGPIIIIALFNYMVI